MSLLLNRRMGERCSRLKPPSYRPGMGTEGGIRSGLRSWMSISEASALRLVTLRELEIHPLPSTEESHGRAGNEVLLAYGRGNWARWG